MALVFFKKHSISYFAVFSIKALFLDGPLEDNLDAVEVAGGILHISFTYFCSSPFISYSTCFNTILLIYPMKKMILIPYYLLSEPFPRHSISFYDYGGRYPVMLITR